MVLILCKTFKLISLLCIVNGINSINFHWPDSSLQNLCRYIRNIPSNASSAPIWVNRDFSSNKASELYLCANGKLNLCVNLRKGFKTAEQRYCVLGFFTYTLQSFLNQIGSDISMNSKYIKDLLVFKKAKIFSIYLMLDKEPQHSRRGYTH